MDATEAIKLITPLISVILGGFVFKWIIDTKNKKEERREKAILFIEDAANNVNLLLSLLFGTFKHKKVDVGQLEEIFKSKNSLYQKKFLIHVYSNVYLKDNTFSDNYSQICRRAGNLVDLLVSEYNSEPVSLSHLHTAEPTIKELNGRIYTFDDFLVAHKELLSLNETAMRAFENAVKTAYK